MTASPGWTIAVSSWSWHVLAQACQSVLVGRRAVNPQTVPFGAADRADQHGIGCAGSLYGFIAAKGAMDVPAGAAEDIFFAHPGMSGGEHPWVRGDIVYFTTPNGGAMFAASSIAWCGSLSHDDYENNVSRVTDNVLGRFARDELLPPLPED